MEKYILEHIKDISSNNPFSIYLFSFINAVLQILFPPYPGDTITIFEGYLTSKEHLNIYFLLFSTLSGTYLSSLLLYLLSYKYGKSILSKAFIIKYFNSYKINRIETWFKKYGSFAIIINKFLPGVGSITFIAAGLFKLPPISAFLSIGIATVIHNSFLITAGRLTGDNIYIIKQTISEYNKIIIIAILLIFAMYSYLKFFYKRKHKDIK